MRYLPFLLALACVSCAKPFDNSTTDATQTMPAGTESDTESTEAKPEFNVTLTYVAAEKVKAAMVDFAPDSKMFLRVRVEAGGCTGFMDKLDLDPNYDAAVDRLIVSQGVRIVVDKRSALYMNGATIDYVKEAGKEGFKVTHPFAKPKDEPEAGK